MGDLVIGNTTEGELVDLLTLDDGLSDWEVDFLDDMWRRKATERPFTPKQESKVHSIWDRLCGKG